MESEQIKTLKEKLESTKDVKLKNVLNEKIKSIESGKAITK